ncbi:MAG: serine protein kinase RIO [Candidatus Micrarchaeota archaeon]|nr:serine protein kinase RIO [Candidatus Micrarchaeota archaeon]MDE1849645.1 serine protein kinase RIO [Candidatus Micrarchaeota archaeon]
MARRVSRRKEPSREKHMIKEQLKIEEGVFDNRTMMNLSRVFTHNIASKLLFLTAKGKEADVYVAEHGSRVDSELVILKIFRIETSHFFKRDLYIKGDPRFEKIKLNQMGIINTWCKKEYGNLKLAELAGVHAPKPYYFSGNVLAMEFIGKDGIPSSTLKNAGTPNPKRTLDLIIEDMKRMYQNELVHADMSEYNILMQGDVPYIIDFGQAVVLGHPSAMKFLNRDVGIILQFFRKSYGIDMDPEEALKRITK